MHQEQFVLVLMTVPVEGALKFDELDFLAIEFRGNARIPVIGNGSEFLREVDAISHGRVGDRENVCAATRRTGVMRLDPLAAGAGADALQ
jgi:hypothetical protein